MPIVTALGGMRSTLPRVAETALISLVSRLIVTTRVGRRGEFVGVVGLVGARAGSLKARWPVTPMPP
jgi:hypothetical protein